MALSKKSPQLQNTRLKLLRVGVIRAKENFEKIAKKSDYDSGFGAARVAEDLVVVGDNWWIERHEYDGNEWWEYKEKPKQTNEIKEIWNLAGGMWDTLAELNEEKR